MAIDLLAGMDETDDGDYGTCWDFDRNDWGGSSYKKSWSSKSSWGPTSTSSYQPWWGPNQSSAGWGKGSSNSGPAGAAGEGPFAGDAAVMPMPAAGGAWWGRSSYGRVVPEAPWGMPVNPMKVGSPDAPYWGDSDGTAAAQAMSGLGMSAPPGMPPGMPPGTQGIPLAGFAPPPPPALDDDIKEQTERRHPWSMPKPSSDAKKDETEKKAKKEKKETKERKENKDGEKAGNDTNKDDVLAEIEALLNMPGAQVQKADFDAGVRRYLGALRGCQGGQQKVKDAMAMLHTYTSTKTRTAVKNWPAYLLTLLKRLEPDVWNAKGQGKGGEEGARRLSNPKALTAGVAAALLRPGSKPAEAPAAEAKADAPAPSAKKEEVEQAPPKPTGPAMEAEEVLPEGWAEGRDPLLEEVRQALSNEAVCPFTGKKIDYQETLLAQMAASFANCRKAAPAMKSSLWRHVQGVANCRDLVECQRAVAAAAAAEAPEFVALAEDVCAMDGARAIGLAADKRPGGAADAVAQTVFEEISLEILMDVLRNPKVSQQGSAA